MYIYDMEYFEFFSKLVIRNSFYEVLQNVPTW